MNSTTSKHRFQRMVQFFTNYWEFWGAETLVVIALFGIISAIAIPSIKAINQQAAERPAKIRAMEEAEAANRAKARREQIETIKDAIRELEAEKN